MSKRIFDAFFSGLGLVVLSPVFGILALLIRVFDGSPIFFKQQRIGLHGRPFSIWKFRTMVPGAPNLGASVTRSGDDRITALGRILRKTKLDELPQLWNVFCGNMSLVGPRPEVPKYVARYTPEQRKVLELKPGITDLATLAFRDEERLLQQAEDLEKFYVNYCIPAKIEMNLRYHERANLWEDTKIIFRTLAGTKLVAE